VPNACVVILSPVIQTQIPPAEKVADVRVRTFVPSIVRVDHPLLVAPGDVQFVCRAAFVPNQLGDRSAAIDVARSIGDGANWACALIAPKPVWV
jgi:hypothetical protein